VRCIFLINLVLFWPFLGLAVSPNEILLNPSLEKEAREISKGLRCLVCQNQSIDDSDAMLARDLRLLVRKKLLAGESAKEIKKYVVSRYGEFVLLKPPLNTATLTLWFSPIIILLLGLAFAVFFFKKNMKISKPKNNPVTYLSKKEKERVEKILGELD